ncbi:hypothetical protein PSOS111911_13520 [Pseudoalteromonas ostreae]
MRDERTIKLLGFKSKGVHMFKFYGYFTSCLGTIVLIIFSFSFILEQRIETGLFGLYGIPIICALYATLRFKKLIISKSELEQLNRIKELESEIERMEFTNS